MIHSGLPVIRFGGVGRFRAIDKQCAVFAEHVSAADGFQHLEVCRQGLAEETGQRRDTPFMIFGSARLHEAVKPRHEVRQVRQTEMQRPQRIEQHARDPFPDTRLGNRNHLGGSNRTGIAG